MTETETAEQATTTGTAEADPIQAKIDKVFGADQDAEPTRPEAQDEDAAETKDEQPEAEPEKAAGEAAASTEADAGETTGLDPKVLNAIQSLQGGSADEVRATAEALAKLGDTGKKLLDSVTRIHSNIGRRYQELGAIARTARQPQSREQNAGAVKPDAGEEAASAVKPYTEAELQELVEIHGQAVAEDLNAARLMRIEREQAKAAEANSRQAAVDADVMRHLDAAEDWIASAGIKELGDGAMTALAAESAERRLREDVVFKAWHLRTAMRTAGVEMDMDEAMSKAVAAILPGATRHAPKKQADDPRKSGRTIPPTSRRASHPAKTGDDATKEALGKWEERTGVKFFIED